VRVCVCVCMCICVRLCVCVCVCHVYTAKVVNNIALEIIFDLPSGFPINNIISLAM